MAKKKINWLQELWEAILMFFRGVKGIFATILCAFVTVGLIGTLCAVIMGVAFAVYLSGYVDATVDDFELLVNEQKKTSQIFVDIGNGELSELEDQQLYYTNRVWVDYKDIPKNLIDAYISTEDKRFWDHNGVDWIRTAKATMYYVMGRSGAGGGSTLTQQLIKNVTGDDDNSPQRKIEEMFRALNLEKTYSKEQILELYLNSIYLSQGCNGVQAASYAYFNKPVSELSLIECAAIASITQNPSKWDPKLHPENNIIRRNSILENMLNQGKITKAEFDQAYDKELIIYKEPDSENPENPDVPPPSNDVTSWYVDVVIEDSIALLMKHYNVTYDVAEKMLYTSGLKIITAMDKEVQDTLEKIYADNETIDSIVGASPGMIKPESAMVVLDPNNGNILGLVGGRGEKIKSRVFNYATQAKRQTGSAIKPLSVYGPSLEAGIVNYSTVIDDSPFRYPTTRTGWPKNSPVGYKGLTPIILGITNSVNTIAVKLVDQLGLDYSYEFLTEKLHITSLYKNEMINGKLINDVDLAALALGGMNYGVSVRELVGGYTMFTNQGVFCQPRAVLKICDTEGEVIINNELKTEICMSKENASIMTKMMNNVVVNGTGSSTKLKNSVFTAGKTGTTSKNNDKWFVGFTPYYLAGVWFGYDQPQSLSSFSGNPAMKIWDYSMIKLHERMVFSANNDGSFNYKVDKKGNAIPKTYTDVIDPGVLTLSFCRDCGMLATDACKSDQRGSRVLTGYFTVDNMPSGNCTCHKTVRICTVSGKIANSSCPNALCKEVTIVVTDSAKYRYENGNYVYRSDEKYVFYDNGDGTYGGLVKTYSSKCTMHSDPSDNMVLASQEDFLPDDERRRYLTVDR